MGIRTEQEENQYQRKIGQQMMIVRMMQIEGKRTQKEGYSLLTDEKIMEWADISQEELDLIKKATNELNFFNICVDAAKRYTSEYPAANYGFVLSILLQCGHKYILHKIGCGEFDKNTLPVHNTAFKVNETVRMERIEEEFLKEESQLEALESCYWYYTQKIAETLKKGIDVEVVRVMLGEGYSEESFAVLILKSV